MPRTGYKNVTLPEVLYERLKQHVKNSQGRYVFISEVVREAIWEYLKRARALIES